MSAARQEWFRNLVLLFRQAGLCGPTKSLPREACGVKPLAVIPDNGYVPIAILEEVFADYRLRSSTPISFAA